MAVQQKKDQTETMIIHERTEEVRDIIERMPHTFARYITYIVGGIISLLTFFGYIVKYPDIIAGEVIISAQEAPLRLIATQSGKLQLNDIRSQDTVYSGQLLAWIDNPADPGLVNSIEQAITNISLPLADASKVYLWLPKDINLGDLTIPYSSFLGGVKHLSDYQKNKLYDKQGQTLSKILFEQQEALRTLKEKEILSMENVRLSRKFLERDSILLAKKIISQAEFEQSLASNLISEDQLKTSLRNSGTVREQINNTKNSIQQNKIVKSEKEVQLDLEIATSFNNQ